MIESFHYYMGILYFSVNADRQPGGYWFAALETLKRLRFCYAEDTREDKNAGV